MTAGAKHKASHIHFITGSDEAAVRNDAQALARELAPDADIFGMETIDGAVESAEAATRAVQETIRALLTLPFLGGSKLVWLKNVSFLADNIAGRSESVFGAMQTLCEVLTSGVAEGVNFVLSAPLADKRRTTFKALSKLAATRVHDLPEVGFRGGEETIVEWMTAHVHERDVQLDADAIEVLAARIGLDALQLESELEKLETAFGKTRPVSADEVRLLVPQTREGGIFDLSRAIEKRNLPLALETLDQLLRQGETGVGILLAAVVPTLRNLLLVKDLLIRQGLTAPAEPQYFSATIKRLPAHTTSHLPRKKDGTINAYGLGIAANHAAQYSLSELHEGFAACAKANQLLLSGSLTEEVILARILIRLLSRKG